MADMFRHIGKTLMLLREIRGLSQAELARLARIGKSQLSKYEHDRELPKLDSLEKILRALRVSHLGFFYTLHFLQTKAEALEAGNEMALDPSAFIRLGLLDETAKAFGDVVADIMRIYQGILHGVLSRT